MLRIQAMREVPMKKKEREENPGYVVFEETIPKGALSDAAWKRILKALLQTVMERDIRVSIVSISTDNEASELIREIMNTNHLGRYEDLAAVLGVSKSCIGMWATGKNAPWGRRSRAIFRSAYIQGNLRLSPRTKKYFDF